MTGPAAGRRQPTLPAISLGLPVFNGERYLAVAVESLLGQTRPDFELVISDNASTDKTERICREYADRDPRIRYHRHAQNVGAAANFRTVFERSRAPYFKWVAVDDSLAPEYLERCAHVLDERADVVLCCTKVTIVDEHGATVRRYDDGQELLHARAADRFRARLTQDSWCNAVYGLIRADVLRRTGLLATFSGSDVVLVAELALYGRFVEVPEYLLFRRWHPEGYSYACSPDKVRQFYAPGTRRGWHLLLRSWRHLYEHSRSIARAPLAWREKVALAAHVARMAWWTKKHLMSELGMAGRSFIRSA
jgi:glycosyltransferase involved in cell wall biosynthesis